MLTFDAIVVGVGPAGAVAARELGLQGLRVALLEKTHHPRAKACGEGLLRGRGVFTLAGMEVRRRVIVVYHRANDAEKTADLWQAPKLR
jgi:flavin-dependent dehydrogenase